MFLDIAVLAPDAAARLADPAYEAQPGDINFCRALIDTGAQSTCITQNAATQAGVAPIGKVPIRGVAGTAYHNNYVFQIAFPLMSRHPDGGVIVDQIHTLQDPIQGAEVDSGGKFDILLGMDVIGTGSLSVEGVGTFSFCF
jgi:hypothetical protein